MLRASFAAGAAVALLLTAGAASAGVYAADNPTGSGIYGIVQFDNNLGVTGTFLTSDHVNGVTYNGGDAYVSTDSGVARYSSSGDEQVSYANVGDDHFADVASRGSGIIAADNTGDGLSGVVLFDSNLDVSSTFLTDSAVLGLTSDGSDIFASLSNGVFEYDASGNILASYMNVGDDLFGSLSFANGILYAADNTGSGLSGVVEFGADFNVEHTFLTEGYVAGLAADGSSVYASLATGVAKYDKDGNLLATYANVGNDSFGALAIAPAAPEPTTWALMMAGVGLAGFALRRRREGTLAAA